MESTGFHAMINFAKRLIMDRYQKAPSEDEALNCLAPPALGRASIVKSAESGASRIPDLTQLGSS